MEPSPSSPTASGAALTSPGMQLKSAPYGRLAGGASVLSTLTMSAPPPTTPAAPVAASSISGTPTSGAIAPPPRLDYFAMSWSWHMLMLSGTTLTPVTRDLTSSCVVATL